MTQLRSDCPVKISDDKYVALGIARDFLRVVPRLEPFCRFTHAVPDEPSCHPASYSQMSGGEMNDRNHSVSRIAETKIWNVVAHGARLFAISTRRQHDNGDVSIGCGKFLAVDIDKANRIGVPG